MPLSAQQFDALCGAVFQAANSVASCTASELARESLALRCIVSELCAATLGRANPRLIERRRAALARSSEVLGRRAA